MYKFYIILWKLDLEFLNVQMHVPSLSTAVDKFGNTEDADNLEVDQSIFDIMLASPQMVYGSW